MASVEVKGLIHRSQWTSDNPKHNYWIRITVTDENGFPVPELQTLHIFLCYRIWNQPIYSYGYIPGECIIPKSLNNGDYPDISQLFGNWEAIFWSNGPIIKKDPNYKRVSNEKLNQMKAKSSTNPFALEMMRKMKEAVIRQN